MTTEERMLLLKDLNARLPHDVTVHILCEKEPETLYAIRRNGNNYLLNDAYYIEEVKPYLFPLSAMTEEVCDEIEEILNEDGFPVYDFMSDGDIIFRQGNVSIRTFSKVIDCLDRNHIDHRGLIPLGLAFDATNLNIY